MPQLTCDLAGTCNRSHTPCAAPRLTAPAPPPASSTGAHRAHRHHDRRCHTNGVQLPFPLPASPQSQFQLSCRLTQDEKGAQDSLPCGRVSSATPACTPPGAPLADEQMLHLEVIVQYRERERRRSTEEDGGERETRLERDQPQPPPCGWKNVQTVTLLNYQNVQVVAVGLGYACAKVVHCIHCCTVDVGNEVRTRD